jgi:hypothetical protein
VPTKPEIALVYDPKFPVKITIELPTWTPIKNLVGGGSVSVIGKLQFQFGPGKRTIELVAGISAKAARAVGTAVGGTGATGAAVVVGTVVGTAALTLAVAELVAWAQEEGVRWAQLLALRDGFAARLAFYVTGDKQLDELKLRMAEWEAVDDKRVTVWAYAGYDAAEEVALLPEADRKTVLIDLGKRYGSSEFSETRNRIFQAVGGFDKEPDTLTIGLAWLPR